VIVLDTHVLIWHALAPQRLSTQATALLGQGKQENRLYCSDITLWEIAMLMSKKRLEVETDAVSFIETAIAALVIQVLPVTPQIAGLSVSLPGVTHLDPADRIIAATAVCHQAVLLTADSIFLRVVGDVAKFICNYDCYGSHFLVPIAKNKKRVDFI
jgi:PIN domain nuclease of toxin-antitoxin system